jgi:transcriptional regulator with PAS, ATPase and Fis domain/ligand-binding sensor domain-containing protein
MGRCRWLMLWLIWLIGSPAFAQPRPAAGDPYVRHTWTTRDGLPQNTVSRLFQTRDGYLWIATYGGLARFDGLRFVVFTTATTPALRSTRTLSLHEDRSGALWIGTEYGGLTRLRDGEFSTPGGGAALAESNVHALLEDSTGRLWVGTSRGVLHVQGESLTAVDIEDLRSKITAFLEAPDGSVWIGGADGLVSVPPLGPAAVSGSIPAHRWSRLPIYDLAHDSHGAILAASEEGLLRITAGRLAEVRDGQGQSLGRLWTVKSAPDGGVWVGTQGGDLLRLRNGSVELLHTAGGTAGDGVLSLLFDREGSLWVGSVAAGLTRWRPREVRTLGVEAGLGAQSVRTVRGAHDGGMWIGTWCGGLQHVSAGRAGVRTISPPAKDLCIGALLEDADGTLWVGTMAGLYRRTPAGTTVFRTGDGLPGPEVFALYRDRAGTLWIGTSGGLARMDAGGFTIYGVRQGLAHDSVRFITEDRAGALWVGTAGGVSRVQAGAITSLTIADGLPHNYVRAVHEDADGAIWIGTYGGGLVRLHDGVLRTFTSRDGLVEDFVSVIIEDGRGDFWLTGNRGISRIARRGLLDYAAGRLPTLSPVLYGVPDGMRNAETNGGGQPAGWVAGDGSLWFPTIEGVAIIHPDEARNPVPPPVVIEDVLVDQQPVGARGGIALAAGTHSLTIRYTALSLAASERNRFRYRLEGFDEEWVDAGARRSAYYTALPPGPYTFRVIATNSHGVWNESGASLVLHQRPYFHQTGWFRALLALALAGAGLGTYRLRVRHLLHVRRQLEQKVTERTAALAERTSRLAEANEQLERVNLQLGRANAQMLGVFDQLQLGVLVTGADGGVVFVSAWAQRVLDVDAAGAVGRRWEECLPLDGTTRAELQADLAASDRPSRRPVTVHARDGQRYALELEAKPDPGDPARRIIYLYDVTEVYDLRRLQRDGPHFHGLVGNGPEIRMVYRQVRDVAAVDATVLIEGETGTGKELVARAIHAVSARHAGPFVAVNCAGLTESLLSSQLFGHRRGAFTGAVSDQVGVFQAAHGGTIFLDEVGDMPMSVQMMLLRVLQEKEITRLGETEARRVDVRVIAATHQNLADAVRQGRFREDVLYRIRVFRIHVPALRDRRQDIPLLVSWFLRQSGADGRPAREVSSQAMDALVAYAWPGNVRELRNAVETAALRARDRAIRPIDLPAEILGTTGGPTAADPVGVEREQARAALARARGNRSEAARLLGVSRSTFYRRLRALDLAPDEPG